MASTSQRVKVLLQWRFVVDIRDDRALDITTMKGS